MESKFAQIMRNSGPARFFVPVGIILIVVGIILAGMKTDNYLKTTGTVTEVREGMIEDNKQLYDADVTYTVNGKTYTLELVDRYEGDKVGDTVDVYYNPENPEQSTNAKVGSVLPIVMIGAGALATVAGIFLTVKAFKKSKSLNETAVPQARFDGFKESGVTEYYFRWDGNTFKPGYLIEDADRKVLFEGQMLKNALVGARTFAFTNRLTGKTEEHEIGHTVSQSFDNEAFSMSSWFKIDGENIWDVLHGRGLRMRTNLFSSLPNIAYDVSKDGAPYAQIESAGRYVHEDEAAMHSVNIPTGRHFRCWTNSNDFETLFLTMFAIAETNQLMTE